MCSPEEICRLALCSSVASFYLAEILLPYAPSLLNFCLFLSCLKRARIEEQLRVSASDWGDLALNPHSAVETCWVALDHSHVCSLTHQVGEVDLKR